MARIAYFDCFSGASGDMILGALLDAGFPFDALQAEASKLALPEGAFSIEAHRVHRAGFTATKLDVNVIEPQRHRPLGEVLDIVNRSTLVASDKECVLKVFSILGEVEAELHGQTLEG